MFPEDSKNLNKTQEVLGNNIMLCIFPSVNIKTMCLNKEFLYFKNIGNKEQYLENIEIEQ